MNLVVLGHITCLIKQVIARIECMWCKQNFRSSATKNLQSEAIWSNLEANIYVLLT